MELSQFLKMLTYPGRGLALGVDPNGVGVCIYFISGRSENSQNRVFVRDADGTVRTQAFRPDKLQDPSLIIYNAIKFTSDLLIVSNGTQTDSPETFFTQWDYEPDDLCTPRIMGLFARADAYALMIVKAAYGSGGKSKRFMFNYPIIQGIGHIITTYDGNDSTPGAFYGEPIAFNIPASENFIDEIWDALNPKYRISLCLTKFSLGEEEWSSNTVSTQIKNRHE